MIRLLDEREIDANDVLSEFGLTRADVLSGDDRIDDKLASALFESVRVRVGDDPAFGLTIARYSDYSALGSLGLAFAAGGSLRDVLARIARFHKLVTDSVVVRFDEEEDVLAVSIEASPEASPHPQAILLALGATANFVRFRLGGMCPRRVILADATEACRAAAVRFFRCEVVAGSTNRIEYAAECGPTLLAGSDVEIASMLERTLETRLARESKPVGADLVAWIEGRLEVGDPTLEEGAKALGTTPRSLQRRLKAENTTFQKVVDDTRRLLAVRYLRAPGTSLTEIAFRLGFADLSSFSRAFRKWYGVSASSYRRTA